MSRPSLSSVGQKGSPRVERLTLGKYPQVRPEEARNRARELAGTLASGVSVAAAERRRRGELTVGELWKLYHAKIQQSNKSPDSSEDTWVRYVEQKWSNRRLSDVSSVEVEKWHLELPAAGGRQLS